MMIFKEIIRKKRDGKPLSKEEIEFAVTNYTNGSVPDYQMSALLMAMFINGLNKDETLYLTESMLESGIKVNVKSERPIVDKHSTGGVGDKVSFVLAPVLAEMGFSVPMLVGRALGFTGGTADKLESTGAKVLLDEREINECVEKFGFSISCQTETVAPADRKIYALRDSTATVESIPLIVASILSKKLAINSEAIVFDVKTGSGAFMKTESSALELARLLVEVSEMYGKKARAVITDMNQPLGTYAGNYLEVEESAKSLQGNPPEDVLEVVSELAGNIAELSGRDYKESKEEARKIILEGKAYERFEKWLRHLGGNLEKNFKPNTVEVLSPESGWVKAINCEILGYLVVELGGGRKKKEDKIDPAVGFAIFKKVGDFVEKKEPLGVIYYTKGEPEYFVKRFLSAFEFSSEVVEPLKLVKKFVGGSNEKDSR